MCWPFVHVLKHGSHCSLFFHIRVFIAKLVRSTRFPVILRMAQPMPNAPAVADESWTKIVRPIRDGVAQNVRVLNSSLRHAAAAFQPNHCVPFLRVLESTLASEITLNLFSSVCPTTFALS
jgi:hypothetical protein